jgi:hypothetical protein
MLPASLLLRGTSRIGRKRRMVIVPAPRGVYRNISVACAAVKIISAKLLNRTFFLVGNDGMAACFLRSHSPLDAASCCHELRVCCPIIYLVPVSFSALGLTLSFLFSRSWSGLEYDFFARNLGPLRESPIEAFQEESSYLLSVQ